MTIRTYPMRIIGIGTEGPIIRAEGTTDASAPPPSAKRARR
jgi:hypothetical protein